MRLQDIKRTMQVFAVKTSIAHERSVAEMIERKLENREPRPQIKSILVLDQLRGYVFLEAPHQRDVMIATSEIRHVKGKTLGQVRIEELDHFLNPEPLTETLEIGDKVEIIAGLFQSEKAYVSQIDEAKDEVTLSLVGSDNPIPIKVHVDYLKVIEKGAGHAPAAEPGDATVVGRGIKEYTFGDESETKEEEVAEEEPSPFEDFEEGPEEQAPETIVYSGRKQKVVGELIDLNIDDDDDDFFDFDDDYEYEDSELDALRDGKEASEKDEIDVDESLDDDIDEDDDWV